MRWYAVMTKPRKEHYAYQNLKRQGFISFFPHYHEWTQPKKVKPRLLRKPYMPRYLFVGLGAGGNQSIYTINNTYGVSSVVYLGIDALPIPDVIVNELQARADDTGEIQLDPEEKKQLLARRGDIVKFREDSALFGFVAEVQRVDKNGTLMVHLDKLLGTHRKVKIKSADVVEVMHRPQRAC